MRRDTGSPDEGLPVLYPGLGDDPWKKPTQRGFEGDLSALYALMVSTRSPIILSPGSDIVAGTWTGQDGGGTPNLFTYVDERSPDDATFIKQNAGNIGSGVALGLPFTRPFKATDRVTCYARVRQIVTAGPADCNLSISFSGRTATIATLSLLGNIVNQVDVNWKTYTLPVAPALVASQLVGWAGPIRMDITGGGFPAHSYLGCSWVAVVVS